MRMASNVSVSVPIWFSLMRIELAIPSSMPRLKRSTLVTKRSSPTSCTFLPSLSVRSFQVSQSSSAQPSSIEMIGYFARASRRWRRARRRVMLLLVERVALRRLVVELARRAVEREDDVLARLVAGVLDGAHQRADRLLVRAEARREAALVADRGGEALVLEDLLQRREDLGAGAERLGERARAARARS